MFEAIIVNCVFKWLQLLFELFQYLAKQAKRKRRTFDDGTEETGDEKSTLHIDNPYDYQGRSFLTAAIDLTDADLESNDPPQKCYIPKACIHTYTGHTKGLSVIKWFPNTAHLLMSAGLDGKVKLWEVYNKRRCVRTYSGHKQAVKDFDFNNDGSKFLTVSYDRMIKLWDTETGKCISRFTNKKNPYCVKFNPDEEKQNLFLVGCSDKKIHCFDLDSGEVTQEYDRHLGNVNTITFIDENRRFVSTSDDKSMRVWEWDIPVDWKYIADPSMHSMPRVALSFTGKWLAGQSMDNQIKVFNAPAKLRENRKKVFKGHMVAGYACGLGFSPDGSYVISGDADGKLIVWDWKTTKLYEKIKAHDKVCIDVLWHPHEASKVATAGWDGLIKLWD